MNKKVNTRNSDDSKSRSLLNRAASRPELKFTPLPIPVLLIGYNRPELLVRRVEELLRNNVEILHISVDGCDSLRETMQETLEIVSLLCKNKCAITYKIHETNIGLAKHITNEISRLTVIHSEIIVLEDDIQIGENFLVNMARGLDYLRVSKTMGIVSAFSPINQIRYFKLPNKWRKTPYFSCWGWLCTREVWEKYVLDISEIKVNEALSNSKTWQVLNKWQQFLWLSRFLKIQRNPYHTWDIQFQFMCFRYGITNIAPVFSLTNNEGFNDIRSAHTKEKKPRWMSSLRIESTLIRNTISPSASVLFSRFIEPLTTSGDSRLIRLRNSVKNRVELKNFTKSSS